MNWWESKAGKLFRKIVAEASGQNDFVALTADVYQRSLVNPKVLHTWHKGGNPSVATLIKILDGYPGKIHITDRSNIIEWTREFKNNGQVNDPSQDKLNQIYSELKKNPEKIDTVYTYLFNNPIVLTARIEDYDTMAKKYIIRVRFSNGTFIIRERTSMYEQAEHVLTMQSFQQALSKKIGTSNFEIKFNWKDSIKKVD